MAENTSEQCWNSFCIATDCDGLHHVDVTGHTWAQARGTIYCPACRGYHATDDCPRGYDSPVFTDYERKQS